MKPWQRASKALEWAELIASAGVIAAAFSGALGVGPTSKWITSIILPAVVVALKLARVF
jgi:hypothetical protein